MKLSVMTVLLGDRPLEEVLKYLTAMDVHTVELGTGGYPGNAHCKPAELLADAGKLKAFKQLLKDYEIEVCALSTHGNYVHPNPDIAAKFQSDLDNTLKLASELGIDRVVGFSGCPGGGPKDEYPNWVTCPWPDDFQEILDYQWNQVLIPYWNKMCPIAQSYGVNRIALEMHPGFCVYNVASLLKLRAAVGSVIGANLDPSHLFWQGVNIPAAIRKLGDAIYFFHAKDTKVDEINTGVNGVLDIKHYGDEIDRSWIFRSVGYGHDYQTWKDIVSNLRMVGYDDVMSIEHEDSLLSPTEGLEKAVSFLKEVMAFQGTTEMFWA